MKNEKTIKITGEHIYLHDPAIERNDLFVFVGGVKPGEWITGISNGNFVAVHKNYVNYGELVRGPEDEQASVNMSKLEGKKYEVISCDEYVGSVAVDSGMAGICDNSTFPGDSAYLETGRGDGVFPVLVGRAKDGLQIVVITIIYNERDDDLDYEIYSSGREKMNELLEYHFMQTYTDGEFFSGAIDEFANFIVRMDLADVFREVLAETEKIFSEDD